MVSSCTSFYPRPGTLNRRRTCGQDRAPGDVVHAEFGSQLEAKGASAFDNLRRVLENFTRRFGSEQDLII